MRKLFSIVIASAMCLVASAQTRSITGNVVDPAGEPIIGASVVELSVTPPQWGCHRR